MQEIDKNIMTIKIIIPYQQWMQYGENKCRGCRMDEYGDIYFVVDISFLFIRLIDHPLASFLSMVNTLKELDKGNAARGDIFFYFDLESRCLFHDRKLKDKATILCLMPTLISNELRDRISLFSNTVVLTPNILLIEHCDTNGYMALLGKIKRMAELLMVEKKQEYMNDTSDMRAGNAFAMSSDIQVKDDCSVYFATSPFQTLIATIY